MENLSYLKRYQEQVKRTGKAESSAAIAFYASMDCVAGVSPSIAEQILQELKVQRANLKMIASENYSSLPVQLAMGNLLTDKYAEGVPGSRFYAGCEQIDAIENEAKELACELFGADHAYVQPHSGADANLVAFMAVLSAKVQTAAAEELQVKDWKSASAADWAKLRQKMGSQKLLGLDIGSGGHLTHGYRLNISAQLFDSYHYGVGADGWLDYEGIGRIAEEVKPLILLAGYSAYPRKINFAKMREIADRVGAVLMVDMAHFAGLVAGKVFVGEENPIAYADIVTTTTHKTLRGPRGGMVLCKKWLAEFVDKGCPMVLGGPLPMVMAAKALAFREALRPDFASYAARIVENAQALAAELREGGATILTGGTDNHLMQVNVFESYGLTGRQAEMALRECGITVNRNALPGDVNGVWYTSGLRLGTPALTTLGMGPEQMRLIGRLIVEGLKNCQPLKNEDDSLHKAKYLMKAEVAEKIKKEIGELLGRFPLYPELILD